VPHALLHNLYHNKVLHERVVFLTVRTEDVPYVQDAERVEVRDLGDNFYGSSPTTGSRKTRTSRKR